MNKEKEELLKNPLVKEIAEAYLKKCFGEHPSIWFDFVRENTKPKEWEILQFINGNNHIVSLIENGLYLNDMQPHLEGRYTLNDVINNDWNKIHAVKRLSDGEVFVVGEYDADGLKIFAFVIHSGKMCVQRHPDRSHGILDLSLIKKARTPIFITFDNKPVYEDNEYWIVFQNYSVKKSEATEDCIKTKHWDELVKFSTREKAEEYILMNKPKLSIQSLLNSGAIVKGSPQYNQIVELAKTIE